MSRTRMTTSSLWIALLLMTVALTESAEIVVGGAKGWTTSFDYDAWASSQNIQYSVGDSLVFVNPDPMSHTVGLVESADAYQRCVFGAMGTIYPIPAGKNYTWEIPASLQGQTFYAVCTIPGHCTDYQKIKGLVLAGLNAATPATAPGATPNTNDADLNRFICWTTAILLIAACFWISG